MSLDELDLLLKKDPIISTWSAHDLVKDPQKVETDYFVHAKTHLPLGETTRYVDNIFKWVSGINKGAFIGAVLGDYGEGKTSFLVHIWAESGERKVLTIPPFEWTKFEEIIDGTCGWILHVVNDSHPDLGLAIQRLRDTFQTQTIESLARADINQNGGNYDEVFETVKRLFESGKVHLNSVSASRVLDFVAQATEIVQRAGYLGLLVLLDEPEVAARALGNNPVQLFLFELADELLRRQGDYGVFISMPLNFHAMAVRQFAALSARLEGRGCFPRLSDLYGPEFAGVLWRRYVSAFKIDEISNQIVSELALDAIGQVGSSERKDLSYGPRSVVSAFNRMVAFWRKTQEAYSPLQFVQDVLDQEVMVNAEYRSKIQSVLRLPDIDTHNQEAIRLLAAFPAGLRIEKLEELGYSEVLRPLARANGPVYRSAMTMGLKILALTVGVGQEDPLRQLVEEIDSEFTNDRRSFEIALASFGDDLMPVIFHPREGMQLEGWQYLQQLKEETALLHVGAILGAFPQSSHFYPQRAAIIMVGSRDAQSKGLRLPILSGETGPLGYDLSYCFGLRWNQEQPELTRSVKITVKPDKPTHFLFELDLTKGLLVQERLAEIVGADRLTPLWTLNLLGCMKKESLPREIDAFWQALRGELLRKLLGTLLNNELCQSLAEEAHSVFGERPNGNGLEILGMVTLVALRQRFPDYVTLIRQPHWQQRVDAYITALTSADVPLAAKRGRDLWKPDDSVASRVLGAPRMSLTAVFSEYESLLTIETKGRNLPLEIKFKTHPLEDEIREMVCSQELGPNHKFKHSGKECWFMPISEIRQGLRGKAYTVEELSRIIAIGKARGLFSDGEHRGERILFCAPLDIDELRAQLRAKLKDLIAEINEYKTLPDYVSNFDENYMIQEINESKDDADYERLLQRMNREFESNHQRLPAYFDRVQGRLRSARTVISGFQGQITGSRDVAQISVPVARSQWRHALELYIVPNLQHEGDDIRTECKAAIEQVDYAITIYTFDRAKSPPVNLSLVKEGLSSASAVESRQTAIQDRTRQWLTYVGEFNRWIRMLLADSDPLYERLLELKNDETHSSMADVLLGEFDIISQQIEDHIQIRNVTGLTAYALFTQSIKELEEKRQEYLKTLKSKFDLCKSRVNSLLEKAKLDGRVSIVFNLAAISACYIQLYSDGVKVIQEHGCNRALLEIADQRRDLQYVRDILKGITEEDASLLFTEIDESKLKVETLKSQVTVVWIRRIAEVWPESEIEQSVAVIDSAFITVRKVRQKVSEASRPDVPKGGHALFLYAALTEVGQVDLKELVLKTMAEVQEPSSSLEMSLDALAELFRRNCIQIHVSRRTR